MKKRNGYAISGMIRHADAAVNEATRCITSSPAGALGEVVAGCWAISFCFAILAILFPITTLMIFVIGQYRKLVNRLGWR